MLFGVATHKRLPKPLVGRSSLPIPFHLGVAGMIPTARVDPSLPLPLSQLVRVSEVIPTAAICQITDDPSKLARYLFRDGG
jgi:hypothetical protein